MHNLRNLLHLCTLKGAASGGKGRKNKLFPEPNNIMFDISNCCTSQRILRHSWRAETGTGVSFKGPILCKNEITLPTFPPCVLCLKTGTPRKWLNDLYLIHLLWLFCWNHKKKKLSRVGDTTSNQVVFQQEARTQHFHCRWLSTKG